MGRQHKNPQGGSFSFDEIRSPLRVTIPRALLGKRTAFVSKMLRQSWVGQDLLYESRAFHSIFGIVQDECVATNLQKFRRSGVSANNCGNSAGQRFHHSLIEGV